MKNVSPSTHVYITGFSRAVIQVELAGKIILEKKGFGD